MSVVAPDKLRALLLVDSRFDADHISDLSSYTEQGYEPGQPAPSTSGFLALEGLGTLTTDAAVDLVIGTSQSGAPVGDDEGGRFTWRYDSGAATTRRGFLQHNKITGFHYARYAASGSGYQSPHGLRTPLHRAIIAYANGADSRVSVSYRDPEDTSWTHVNVDTSGAWKPCLVALPRAGGGQRILCLYLRNDYSEGGTSYWTLSASYSEDDGATWSAARKWITGWKVATSSATFERIRAVYHNGYITVLVSGYSGVSTPEMRHLLSADLGSSVTEIESYTGSGGPTGRYSWDLAVNSAGTVIAFYGLTTVSNYIHYATKATPFSTFSGSPDYDTQVGSGVVTDTTLSEYALSACVDDEGFLWLFSRPTAVNRANLICTRLNLDTLQTALDYTLAVGTDVRHPAALAGNNVEYLTHFHVFPWRDRLLVATNHESAAATTENSLSIIELGGYSSLDWRNNSFGWIGSGSTLSGLAYLPLQVPSAFTGWTTTAGGSEAIDSDGLVISTTAATQYYTRSGGAGRPMLVWARIKVTSGGSLGSNDVAILLDNDNGTTRYTAILRLRLNGANQEARVYDNLLPGQVGSDVTGLGTDFVDYLFVLEDNEVALFYKAPSESLWTVGPAGTLSSGASAAAVNSLQWAHRATATAVSKWAMLLSSIDDEAANHGLTDFTNPDDLIGRPFSLRPLWIGKTEGMQVRAKGGPAYKGDSWTFRASARYGARNLTPANAPSVDTPWRSASNTLQTLAWEPNDGSPTRLLGSSIGICLLRPNFKSCYLEGHDSGSGTPGTWTTLLTINTTSPMGTGLLCDVAGDWLIPSASTAAGSRYLQGGELIGGYAILTWTGGGGGTAAYPILDNTAGVWRDPASSAAAEIRISGDTSSISGDVTIEIVPPAVVAVKHGATSDYDAYRLRIPASQTTYQGYYTLGLALIGPLLVFGTESSWGRVEAVESQVERSRLRSGMPVTRTLGRPRRRAELAWTEPLPTRQLYGSSPAPDYLVARNAAGYPGLVARRDGHLLSGLLARSDGFARVVYLPAVDAATVSTSAYVYAGPPWLLYGSITGPVTVTSVLGDEAETETVTINTVTIEEEG